MELLRNCFAVQIDVSNFELDREIEKWNYISAMMHFSSRFLQGDITSKAFFELMEPHVLSDMDDFVESIEEGLESAIRY